MRTFYRDCGAVITSIPKRRLFENKLVKLVTPPLGTTSATMPPMPLPFTFAANSVHRNLSVPRMDNRRFGTTTAAASTADGTRVFFEWLEQRYGARFGGRPLPMDASVSASPVVTKDSLEVEDLQKLVRHEISVLKIRNFYPRPAAAVLGQRLAREGHTAQNWKVSTSRGLESSDVATVGKYTPYNIAVANRATDEYFRNVRKELRDRRGLSAIADETKDTPIDRKRKHKHEHEHETEHPDPTLWPLDLLRLELDEVWPTGAGLARKNHQPSHKDCMGGGLPRLMVGPTRWKKGLVHVDELAPLDPSHGCFSANLYLQLPYDYDCDGGDDEDEERKEQPVMEVWPLGIRSKWDWYRNAPTLSHLASQDPEGQVILRKVLGDDHKLQISAAPGDLVLLCVQRPHCAMGFGHETESSDANGGTRRLQTRVSLQCFLQYSGDTERLTIDS